MPEELIKAKIVLDDAEAKKQLDDFQRAADKQAKEQEKATKAQAKAEEKAAKEAERARKKTAEDYEKLGKQMAIFGAAALAGYGIAVKATMDYNVELETLHKKTGIAVEDIAGLGYAAQMEEASLESLATGLKFLAKNADDAARGNKAAADAFARAGIQVTDSEGRIRPVKDLMLDLANTMANMPNEATKTGLALDLLGRSGQDLVPMLSLGKTEIANLAAEAEKLGIVTRSQTAKAWDDLDDTLVKTQMSLKGAQMSISNALLPSVAALAEGVSNAAIRFSSMSGESQAFIAVSGATTGALALLAGGVLSLVGWMQKLSLTMTNMSMTTFGWIGAAIALIGVIAGISAAVAKNNAETRANNTELQKLLKTDGDVIDSLEKHNKLTNDQADSVARIGELFPQFVTAWDEYGRAIALDTQRLKEYNAELDAAAAKEAALRQESAQREYMYLQGQERTWTASSATNALMFETVPDPDRPGQMLTRPTGLTAWQAAEQAQQDRKARLDRMNYLRGILNPTTTTTNPNPNPNPNPYGGGGGGGVGAELDAIERLSLASDVLNEKYQLSIRERGLVEGSSEALALKQGVLADQLQLQAEKVSVLDAEYKKLVATKGDAADASQQMYLKLLQEQTAYRDLQNALAEARAAETAGMTPEQEAKYNLIKSQIGSGNPIIGDPEEWNKRIIGAVGGEENFGQGVDIWAKLNGIVGGIEAEASYFQHLAGMVNSGQLALPKYHMGGRNRTGAEQLAILRNDETVLPPGIAPVQIAVNVSGNSFGAGADPYGFGGQLARGLIDEMRVRGVKIGGR